MRSPVAVFTVLLILVAFLAFHLGMDPVITVINTVLSQDGVSPAVNAVLVVGTFIYLLFCKGSTWRVVPQPADEEPPFFAVCDDDDFSPEFKARFNLN